VIADIAVVMPHYCCETYLAQAVDSVLGQKNVSLELFVIDDASPTERWRAALTPFRHDPRLHVLRTSRNVGPWRIDNWLFGQVRSPYIAFQDADDYSDPERLWLQVGELEKSRADIVGSSYFEVSATGEILRVMPMPRNVNSVFTRTREVCLLHGSTIVRRSVLTRLRGLDGTDCGLAADTDFHLRALFACKMRNLKRPLYYYRRHAGSLTARWNSDAPERAAYSKRMTREHDVRRAAWWRRLLPLPGRPPLSLSARPNDVAFEVSPVAI
jgi:glycosyltransferase involved in cell wall biosynthesis